jgi:hypothetical protein
MFSRKGGDVISHIQFFFCSRGKEESELYYIGKVLEYHVERSQEVV